MEQTKKAILTVSFGTSHHDTREKTIDAIENDIRSAFPQIPVYRAWTSKMIIRKLKDRDNIHVCNVEEAMKQMKQDHVTDVILQPTHVINGIENDTMKEDALRFSSDFSSITFGTPLLTTKEDIDTVISALAEAFSYIKKNQALVFMGHGTSHYSNPVYAALDYTFKEKGYKNIFMGTVEAYPGVKQVLELVKEYAPEEVILAPFMIVAGDHAKNDMAGSQNDSWTNLFKSAGFKVTPVVRGLGEYPQIRELFVRHLKAIGL